MITLLRNRSLLTLCLAGFSAYTGAGMISTVRVLYVHSHGGSLGILSAMASAFLVANFVCQYPWGLLTDRWGRKPVLLVGLTGQALLAGVYVFISDPVLFVGLRVLEGAAAASILPSARAAIADLFPDNQRGRAYGLFSAFFNLGFLVGPAAGGLLAAIGYSWVFFVAVGIRLVSAAVVLRGLPNLKRSTFHEIDGTEPGWRGLIALPLVAAYLIAFGDYLWIGFDLTLAPLWMRHHLGASIAMIGIAYSVWALPSALLVPFGGRLADRYPRWALILVAGLGQLPMYALYAVAHSIYPILFGFALQASLYAVVSPAVDAHVAKSSPAGRRGRIQSTYSAVGVAGAFAGASAFVPLYAVDYRLPLVAQGIGYGLVILVGGLLIAFSEQRRRASVEMGGPEPDVMDEPGVAALQ